MKKSSSRTVRVELKDYGEGIPEDIKMKIFERLFRARSKKKAQGTGLGLYIVKKTLERYGGDVIIKDKVPKGSIFQLMIKTPTT